MSVSTRILAIDTATEACSVALWDNGKVYRHFEISPREHTQKILPTIQHILADADITLTELDAIAFGRGPGSFTGVRIGVGVAQGLALGASLPMIGVSNLMTMAQGAYETRGAKRVITAIDARMGEVYFAAYELNNEQWQAVFAEQVISPELALSHIQTLQGQWHYAGTGFQAYPQLAEVTSPTLSDSQITLPAAENMLVLALKEWFNGNTMAAAEAEPTYLRNEVTWKKLPGRE